MKRKKFLILFSIFGFVATALFFAGCGTSIVTLYHKDKACDFDKKDQPEKKDMDDKLKKRLSKPWMTAKN